MSRTKLSVRVRPTFSPFTMNNVLLEQTRVCAVRPQCEPHCLGLRPFVVTHFNAIVLRLCDWVWRAVVIHLPLLSLYWADC